MQSYSLNSDPNQLIKTGLRALNLNKPSEARDAFKQVIAMGKANTSIWLALAYAYRGLNDVAEMLNAAEQSIRLEPRNPRAYILKADHYLELNDRRAAGAFYQKALSVAPPQQQTPNDLRPELQKAQQQLAYISKAFEDHLEGVTSDVKCHIVNEQSERFLSSINMLKGKEKRFIQEPRLYFFPGLKDGDFFDSSQFDWVKNLEAATADIQSELKSVLANTGHRKQFNPYIQGETNRPQSDPHGLIDNTAWSTFDLWKDGEEVKENTALCPKTAEAIKAIPSASIQGRSPNILFSLLKAGSKIPPHNGLLNTRLICHLPLIIPEKCGFRVGNSNREWQEGKVWLFDDTIEHEAWNNSDMDRYILLFEVWKPELSTIERKQVSTLIQSIDTFDSTG